MNRDHCDTASCIYEEGCMCFCGGCIYQKGKAAKLSDCGRYRFRLTRYWNCTAKDAVVFVMLNPSTADAQVDDPTITRCVNFAESWGYGNLYVVNVFAFRATDPKDLRKAADPVGPANDLIIRACAASHRKSVIAAWGSEIRHWPMREAHVLEVLRQALADEPLLCLGATRDGFPRHPLYLKGDTKPVPYTRDMRRMFPPFQEVR